MEHLWSKNMRYSAHLQCLSLKNKIQGNKKKLFIFFYLLPCNLFSLPSRTHVQSLKL